MCCQMFKTHTIHLAGDYIENCKHGTYALTSKWHRDAADMHLLCHFTMNMVLHRLGGCSHPDIITQVIHRHGAAVSKIVHAIQPGR